LLEAACQRKRAASKGAPDAAECLLGAAADLEQAVQMFVMASEEGLNDHVRANLNAVDYQGSLGSLKKKCLADVFRHLF
jgi:hypothetical protein